MTVIVRDEMVRHQLVASAPVSALAGVTTPLQRESVTKLRDNRYVPPVVMGGAGPIQPKAIAGVVSASSLAAGAAQSNDPGAAVPALGPPKPVRFTAFKVRLWERGSGVVNAGDIWGGIKEMTLLRGRYVLKFDAPTDVWIPFTEFQGEVETKVLGKRIVVEKAKLDKEAGSFTVQINLLENPLPLLLLIPAAIAAVGGGVWMAGEGVENSLESVDKVIVDVTDALWQWLIIGSVALGLWFFLFKPMARKGGR